MMDMWDTMYLVYIVNLQVPSTFVGTYWNVLCVGISNVIQTSTSRCNSMIIEVLKLFTPLLYLFMLTTTKESKLRGRERERGGKWKNSTKPTLVITFVTHQPKKDCYHSDDDGSCKNRHHNDPPWQRSGWLGIGSNNSSCRNHRNLGLHVHWP